MQDEIVEIDAAQKIPDVHYNSEHNVINLPAIVGCLNWIALRTRPDIAWATSRATSHEGASFDPTGDKSQQGLTVYHGVTSENKNGGNLVQWRSNRQDLIAKSTCEAELIAPSEALQQTERHCHRGARNDQSIL